MAHHSDSVNYFSPSLSRFPARLLYWIFLPCDLVCLSFQAAGGALSTTSSGTSTLGVNLALAGLSLQVVGMVVFSGLFGDYLFRLTRSAPTGTFNLRVKLFFGFMAAAFLLILVRCAYRVAELHQGYSGSLISDQGLFIGLEGV